MEERLFKELKAKKCHTLDDITVLIVICEELFSRNAKIAEDLRAAIGKIDSLERRLRWYRTVTVKGAG